jgi:hypothetical protein
MKSCFTRVGRAIVGGWKYRIRMISGRFLLAVPTAITNKYVPMKCLIVGGVLTSV